jgi:hypothetical protein
MRWYGARFEGLAEPRTILLCTPEQRSDEMMMDQMTIDGPMPKR